MRAADDIAADWTELIGHLVRTTALSEASARRVVRDVIAYFDETTEAFVRRRHRELQLAGRSNADSFGIIADELSRRPVAAPALTERQIRRVT